MTGALLIEDLADDPGPEVRRELADCWTAVTDAGGAVGFAAPADVPAVEAAVDELLGGLHPDRCRLLLARLDGELAGWVALSRGANPLVAHWGIVQRLQVHPAVQRGGIGRELMRAVHRSAASELGLDHLHLTARSGMGLEDFYARLGYREVGRWPGALRVAPGDDRDEVLLFLDLTADAG